MQKAKDHVMTSSTSVVSTLNASRYLQQLCKHWGHRFTATFDPSKGKIDFGEGEHVSLAATDEALTTTVTAASADKLPQLEKVVADHLNRFGFREELIFDWQKQG
jgi:hypothetical protein